MKSIIFVLLFIFIHFESSSQNYQVTYDITFSPNSNNLNYRSKEKGLLIISNNRESVFVTENFLIVDSLLIQMDEKDLDPYSELDNFRKTSSKNFFKTYIKKDYEKKGTETFQLLGISQYKYDQNNYLKWDLHSDTLKLNNMICHKATTKYAGRQYVAWFTTEIPIPDGPFKFYGLPGMIVKISDTENHFNFELVSFEKVVKIKISRPYLYNEAIEVSQKEFIKLQNETILTPLKQITDAGMVITSGDISKSTGPRKQKTNFIERE
ncbi:GLPGLI family protein [Emticicia sp. CRIBPO]|uniref:GLPGLI family protein n=1 Tax=Emticicia sp. CRIBPO TaxID=2683258 RepID=UPI00141304AE|nr:GLPGLI family protein [Emticicia sp. CRIBPO]NBA87202.1 GLPGLI family protein [Emticicia sp. CRIBPO]